MATDPELNRAYVDGRNSYWSGEVNPNEIGTAAYTAFEEGLTDAYLENARDEPWLDGLDDKEVSMAGRKSLDDVLSNDRSVVRAARYDGGGSSSYVDKGWSTFGKGGGTYEKCYHTHKPLKIGEFVIYGGSCSSPAVTDADVYIGFDGSMKMTSKSWPWKKGTEFLFQIPDGSIPAHPEEFKKLVAWTRKQLEAGLKVHCGCIGGHGRTGMFLSALVCEMTGEKDAIEYVRANYCSKVVETPSQVDFLHEHFGITKTSSSKQHSLGKVTSLPVKTKSTKAQAVKRGNTITPVRSEGYADLWTPANPEK